MLTPLASKLLGWFTKGIEDLQNNKLYDSSLQLPNHVQMKTCKHDLLFMWLHNWSDYSDNILREDSPISLQESVSQNKHADQEIKESLSEYLSQVNNGSLHISLTIGFLNKVPGVQKGSSRDWKLLTFPIKSYINA